MYVMIMVLNMIFYLILLNQFALHKFKPKLYQVFFCDLKSDDNDMLRQMKVKRFITHV